MNDKKICFVSAVNDDILYNECLFYLKNLNVPNDFEIEFMPLRNMPSMCSAYNYAIKNSDAKYKVYLHQDVFIIYKNFINDIIEILTSNKSIGIMGVCGCKNIPPSGVWWEGSLKFGKVFENRSSKLNLLSFDEVTNDYEIVSALDGLILITQYDLKWRDDLFDSWHFYDVSQCLEFKKLGFEAAIPRQSTPWCIHDCGIVNVCNYDNCKQIFINNYHSFLI